LRPLASWDCGFESHRAYEGLSLVNVVCFEEEFCETNRSLIYRSPTECGVCVCVISNPQNEAG